ncbi:MAG: hypothetical protein SGJ19_26980 [Planctomycetia bacterium]|nr:hypothetical protein [Planctomycetia bacterium]
MNQQAENARRAVGIPLERRLFLYLAGVTNATKKCRMRVIARSQDLEAFPRKFLRPSELPAKHAQHAKRRGEKGFD